MRHIFLFLFLIIAVDLLAQPDNRYCGPGDTPNFGAEKDGPAALPNRCINTALSSTPSPGKVIKVSQRTGVVEALEHAKCGDILELQAGSTFAPFALPAKHCDAGHWITIRTSAPDSALPPEGTRVTPCYAGLASLPARPRYDCAEPKNVLAKVELRAGAGAIGVPDGANHYRLIGLEITRMPDTGIAYGLVKFEGSANHIVFDRCWIHGSALDETTRGIHLGTSSYVGIVDSYFSDFHCIARTGACTDAQAIEGGNGSSPMGVYKIVGNYMEGAAETVMFGGAKGTVIPADIEIRRNYMFKPLTWLPGNPDFIGRNFIVKNLFELKNAERVLFEGNVLENTWGGYSQVGYGILLTPRGSWAAVQDVTIRYSTISHVGSGMQLAASGCLELCPPGTDSLAAGRWSIHDVLIDDIDSNTYRGDGIAFQISSGLKENPPLNNVMIDHVTVVTKHPLKNTILVGVARVNPKQPFNITFTNNLVPAAKYTVWSTGAGQCVKNGDPDGTFRQCWTDFKITHNAIIGYDSSANWPAGNFYPRNFKEVGFRSTDADEATSGFRLQPNSRFAGKGTDGKDIGADMAAIEQAVAGVR
jgi:hypothetical protein